MRFTCPKQKTLFWLKAPKKWWSLLEIFEWDINLGSDDLAQKGLFPQFGWEKGCHIFKAFFLETRIIWKSDILKDSFFQFLNMMIWSSVETYCDSLE